MNCLTIDELSKYIEDLLNEKDFLRVEKHLQNCSNCQIVVEELLAEQSFIKDTLQTPSLPDDFAESIIGNLEPYQQEKIKRKGSWKKVMLSAAGVTLAVGISAALSPSFAQLIGGFFSSEEADEGLRLAMEAGLTERVDLAVEDQGVTLKVEDIMADSSRVTLSYQVLKNGKPQNTFIEEDRSANSVAAIDSNENELGQLGYSWWDQGDYGVYEFSLRDYNDLDQMTVRFDIEELSGEKGNWQLDVPIDLSDKRQLTKILPLQDASFTASDVIIELQEMQMAPSSTELFFETSFTEEKRTEITNVENMFKQQFGLEAVESLMGTFETDIAYHLEDENGMTLYSWNTLQDKEGFNEDAGMLQGTGEDLEALGHIKWVNSFIPKKEQSNLTFVLDGVYKTEPADFSITINPKKLSQKPFSFEFEGNQLNVVKAKNETDYHFRKSLKPLAKDTTFVIKMEGEREAGASELGWWLIEDGEGNVYSSGMSGSVSNNTLDMELTLPALHEIPEKLNLHLFSVKRYEPTSEPWKVPLF